MMTMIGTAMIMVSSAPPPAAMINMGHPLGSTNGVVVRLAVNVTGDSLFTSVF